MSDTEYTREQWGKPRPGNYFDQVADWCGNREPHPRHGWRGFAGGHNTDSLWCLGTADTDAIQVTAEEAI